MTSGGYTKEEAIKFQTFGPIRKACSYASKYKGKQPPKCFPVCEACVNKWLAEIEKQRFA